MKTQLICVVVIQHHLVYHDIRHFPELFQQMMTVAIPWIFVLDKGYDAELFHQMINSQKILSIIPVRNRDCLISITHDEYRKQMRRNLMSTHIQKVTNDNKWFSVI